MSLHAACFDSVDIPWILQNLFYSIPVFGGKVSLIFLTIDLQSDLQLICILAILI